MVKYHKYFNNILISKYMISKCFNLYKKKTSYGKNNLPFAFRCIQ